jgi:hypothetical protein
MNEFCSRQTLFHKFFDGEWLLGLLRPVHPAIVMRHRFEMANGAGEVSRLAFRSLSFGGDLTWRSWRWRGFRSALSESEVKT